LATFHAFEPLTCFACTTILQTEHDHQIQAAPPRADREDEEEFLFKGIPIAGENDGDSEERWKCESWDKGDEGETDNDSITQNHTWFSPVHGVNIRATDDIAFRIGPKKDGVIDVSIHSPIPLHTNPYCQLLTLSDDITPHPSFEPTPLTSRARELNRLVHHGTLMRITNAQRLAQTVGSEWRLNRRITNRQNQQRLDQILDLHVAYINDPTITNPPSSIPSTLQQNTRTHQPLYQCMSTILQPPDQTTINPPRTPPDQPIKRKESWEPTFQTTPGTPDPPSPRTGNKKQRISRAYLQMLLKARKRGRIPHVSSAAQTNTSSQTQLSASESHQIPTKEPHNVAPRTTKDPS
jgi:hypothetical protein